jgi:hypothetical protein
MYYGIFAAFFIAFALTGIAVVAFGRRGPWGAAWTFFLFLFLALWIVSIYLPHVGPLYWGIAWIPLIITGVIIALLLATTIPGANEWRDESIRDTETSKPTPVNTAPKRSSGISHFFWILIIIMVVIIMIGMLNPQPAV